MTRTEVVDWGLLGESERARLAEKLYRPYTKVFPKQSRSEFQAMMLPVDDIRLALFYSSRGEFAGFAASYCREVMQGGKRTCVFRAPVIIDPRFKGGSSASLFGLREALAFKVRNPRVRVGYLGVIISPASYALIVRHARRAYPRRGVSTPRHVAELIASQVGDKGWSVVRQEPIVIQTALQHASRSWLKHTDSLQGDPDVAYFASVVPGWTAGEGVVLWLPMDFADLAWRGGAFNLSAARRRASTLARRATAGAVLRRLRLAGSPAR